uniref:Uncharacterized protein n=1 Tax=Rhizophora mucronata TaxID=61149 RepID=A0A2P2QMW4_RHIMU
MFLLLSIYFSSIQQATMDLSRPGQ